MPKTVEIIPSQINERSKERVHRSVRVFAVAPIRAEQLQGMLDLGASPDEMPLVEVVLAQKADTQLVTAIGGRIKKGEDLLHAGMRKVFEESLLTRESLRNLTESDWHGTPIPYQVTRNGESCEALLLVMPFRSATVSLHEPREENSPDSVYKIEKLVTVTPLELNQLFKHGSVETRYGTYHMFGHLTEAPSRDVSLGSVGRSIQQREFERVFSEISAYERVLRQETLLQINTVRRLHRKPVATTLAECGSEEMIRGFLAAQMILGFTDERIRDKENGQKPTRSTDLLTASLYMREFTPEQLPDALLSLPTAEVRRTRNVLKHALRATVMELYSLMGEDIRPYMTKKNLFPLHLRDIADFVGQKPQSLSYLNTIAALRAIWPQVIDLPLHEHTKLLKHLDDLFIDELASVMRKSRDVIKRALEFPERIPRHIAGEIQKTRSSFQQHHPINEVASAIERPFVQMLHIMGLHPYKNIPSDTESDAVKRTRGEMLMIMSAFFTAIPVIEEHVAADNSLFENGLARFLKYPPQLDEMQLKNVTHTILRRETEKVVGERALQLWYDKRPLKSVGREWFKKLQEPRVLDRFSHNFVIHEDNFSKGERSNIPMRLDIVEAFREALLAHYRRQLAGSGWQVSILPGTHKKAAIDTVRKFITIESKKDRDEFVASKRNGFRPGSIGNLIIREKFVLALTGHGEEHLTEVCIYPFQSTQVDGTVLSGSNLIAFTEKLLDDMEGRYLGYRLIQTDERDPTGPSPLELWEPAVWSASRFGEIKLFQHKPKKKRTKKQ